MGGWFSSDGPVTLEICLHVEILVPNVRIDFMDLHCTMKLQEALCIIYHSSKRVIRPTGFNVSAQSRKQESKSCSVALGRSLIIHIHAYIAVVHVYRIMLASRGVAMVSY